MEQVVTSQNEEEVKTKKTFMDKRTPAQIAFDKMQEKRVSYQQKRANIIGHDINFCIRCLYFYV